MITQKKDKREVLTIIYFEVHEQAWKARAGKRCSTIALTLLLLPFLWLDGGGGGGGVTGDGGTDTPAAASKDTAASVLPGPAHCIPRTGEEEASSAMKDGAPEKKGLLWACMSSV